jgi:hypothetical protein
MLDKNVKSVRLFGLRLLNCTNFDGLKNQSYPIVELLILQASEWFAKRKISNDIKGCEVSGIQ